MKTGGTRIEDSLISDDDEEFLRCKSHPMKIIKSNEDKTNLIVTKDESPN